MSLVKRAIVIVIAALALLPVASAAPSRTAHVSITSLAPFTVYGSGFARHERVKITVDAKTNAIRVVVANAKGAFTARFATVTVEKCASYAVRVVGGRGSVAVKKVIPECAPPAATGGAPEQDPPALNATDPIPKKK